MSRRPCCSLLALMALLLTLACPANTPGHLTWQVAPDSVGPVHFGMSHLQAAAALGVESGAAHGDSTCDYWIPDAAPAGVAFMIENGTVVRVDVDSTGVVTLFGLHVGSPVDSVRSAFGGRLRDEPHKYESAGGWRYLTIFSTDSSSGLVFEVDSHVVRSYRAGRWPAVGYVERCS